MSDIVEFADRIIKFADKQNDFNETLLDSFQAMREIIVDLTQRVNALERQRQTDAPYIQRPLEALKHQDPPLDAEDQADDKGKEKV